MWKQIQSNKTKSVTLSMFMAMLLIIVGLAFGFAFMGPAGGFLGAMMALLLWIFMLAISYFSGDKIILASSGAKKITHDDFPELFNVVEEMKIASGFPRIPDIYIINDASPNAFATGRSPESASVAVTSGLLQRVNRQELQGVIAHEMSHIVNRDVLFMMMMGVMVGAIVMLADMFYRITFYSGMGRRSRDNGQAQIIILAIAVVFLILAPFAAQIIYFSISRKREYLADACTVQFTRYPDGLASALEKIAGSPQDIRTANRVTAPMYISNPFASRKRAFAGWLSTHPPIEERVRILRGMAGNYSLANYQKNFTQNSKADGRMKLFSQDEMRKSAAATPAPAAPAYRQAPIPQQFVAPGAAAMVSQPAPAQPVVNRGAVNDFFWKKDGYGFIDCGCGVRLKIPPKFHARTVFCPKCGKKYDVPA